MGRRLWLLELDLGHVVRVSTEAIDVQTEQGAELSYDGGLSEVGAAYAESESADQVSIPIEVLTEEVDWARLAAQGTPLAGRRATLRRWEEGTTLERARVVLRGLTTEVAYGRRGEALTFSIERSIAAESATLPHPQAVVDSSTWPITVGYTVPDKSSGVAYPVVIGCPGANPDGPPLPAVPVVYGQFGASETTSYIVVSDGPVEATNCRLWDMSQADPSSSDSSRPITQVTDNLGRVVSVTTTTAPSFVEDAEWQIGLEDSASYGRGVKHRGEGIRGAGQVLRWALERYVDVAVDWGRFEAIAAKLDAYKVDTHLNTATNIWEWVQGELLPLLPITLRESESGLYPALWRWSATARDAVDHLDATRGTGRVTRTSLLKARADVYTELAIEYRPSSGEARWHSRRVMTSAARRVQIAPAAVDDERVLGSQLLSDAQLIYGVRPLVIQAACVWDDATAVKVLRDRVNAHAWPRRTVSYEGPADLERRKIGEVVLVTDPDIHLDRAVALVEDVLPGSSTGLDLILLDHPQLRSRLV